MIFSSSTIDDHESAHIFSDLFMFYSIRISGMDICGRVSRHNAFGGSYDFAFPKDLAVGGWGIRRNIVARCAELSP